MLERKTSFIIYVSIKLAIIMDHKEKMQKTLPFNLFV